MGHRIGEFARKFNISGTAEGKEQFLALLVDVARINCGNSDGITTGVSSSSGVQAALTMPTVNTNICCFATGKSYTEAILGVGVNRMQKNLTTQGELLSWEAYGNGVQSGTDKSPFEFFLPVWINQKHAAGNPQWCALLKTKYIEIAKKAFSWSHEVTVLKEFSSNNKDKVVLKEKLKGWVEKVDPNGDMSVAFEGIEKKQWVFQKNQKKFTRQH